MQPCCCNLCGSCPLLPLWHQPAASRPEATHPQLPGQVSLVCTCKGNPCTCDCWSSATLPVCLLWGYTLHAGNKTLPAAEAQAQACATVTSTKLPGACKAGRTCEVSLHCCGSSCMQLQSQASPHTCQGSLHSVCLRSQFTHLQKKASLFLGRASPHEAS